MSYYINYHRTATAVAEALGLDPSRVTRMVITIAADEATVEATTHIGINQIEGLAEALRHCRLVDVETEPTLRYVKKALGHSPELIPQLSAVLQVKIRANKLGLPGRLRIAGPQEDMDALQALGFELTEQEPMDGDVIEWLIEPESQNIRVSSVDHPEIFAPLLLPE